MVPFLSTTTFVGAEFKKHVVINHTEGKYTKDGFSTNNMENYWSHLKRMIKGTHISVSDKHLPKYLAEHSFRYTHRATPDKMFDMILNHCEVDY